MVAFGKKVVKFRIAIIILAFLLLIPSAYGYIHTRINYDVLDYLPGDIETMKGQDILLDDFGKGAFSLVVVKGMSDKDAGHLKDRIEKVDHVAEVIWYDSFADVSIPMELLPNKVKDVFKTDDSTLMAVFFDGTTSADGTLDAIEELRNLTKNQCMISGMSSIVLDTKKLIEKETIPYILIAVLLTSIILSLFMDSFLIPVFFLLSIGLAIFYNLGSNIFMGEISFLTKALSAVLQLGVTADYSIFLWHSYKENKVRYDNDKNRAMAHAIGNTMVSVTGSSITTIAGFFALCFMSFTLGLDIGIVMMKGVVIGVISCVTILPAMVLVCDKALEKTMHRPLLPDLTKIAQFIIKFRYVFIGLFLILLVPFFYGQNHAKVYYNLDETLPKSLESIKANTELNKEFDMSTVEMILVDSKMESKDTVAMLKKIENLEGVKFALGMDSLIGTAIPSEAIPDSLSEKLKKNDWQLMLISSEYKVATDDVNDQIDKINKIVKQYDKKGMVIGEAPCTKDLIEITDHDFKVVSAVSIGAIFLIIMFVFKSLSIAALLVAAIEFAIFINMGIPYYTNTTLPFIASVVIGTIQLGATVDYAILMTTRYKKERIRGAGRKDAVTTALSTSMSSIIVSALGFFAATFGVGMYSSVDMVGALCNLLSRGAIVSMFVVTLIVPSFLMVFDNIILHTSLGFSEVIKREKKPKSKAKV